MKIVNVNGLVLDVDDYSVDLDKISKQFVNKNLLLCRSKSGGGHIFIFTKKFVLLLK
jgi:hypothetical protein